MPRAMKDSGIKWIGFIPAEWTIIKIKHLCNKEKNSFQDGDWIESPFITNEGIRYLTTGNVGDGIFKRQGNGHISEDTFAELNCKYAYPNDLVISRLNAPYGRACILPSDEKEYVLAVDIVILRTDHDKRYLCYLMQCQGYQNTVQDEAKGTTMKRISRTNLGNIYLPIAPLEEQQRIADYLDGECARIDSIVEKTRASIVEYKKLKQAIITRAVTKGMRPARPMKDSGIEWLGEIPADWEIKKLKTCISFVNGFAFESSALEKEGIFPVIRIGDIKNGKVDFQNTNFINEATVLIEQFRIKKDDILIAMSGATVGKLAYITDEPPVSFINQRVGIIRSSLGKFIYYYLSTDNFLKYILLLSDGTAQPNISTKNINDYYVVFPPLEEQEEIAAYLDGKTAAIDSLIEKKGRLVTELERLKKSLIFEYVTGKKEAPERT